jgi:beta-glucosidase
MAKIVFPKDFVWGAATSAYQIEGAVSVDGRGESIWDRFCHTPGKIADGSNAEVAADHYHLAKQDVDLMMELGLSGYRFSVAWPRILPEGRGRVNPDGLDFYDRLVDALLDQGIEPYVTLYHWDLPQVLEDEGGWPARSVAEAFAEYAETVAYRLGDRVKRWITINEPWVVAHVGHLFGEHAPGRTSMADTLAASHHLLLAHGLAVERIRSAVPDAEVGFTVDLEPHHPASRHPLDVEAAILGHEQRNSWYLDPVAGMGYPPQSVATFGWHQDEIQPGDMEIVAAPLDFVGINYYQRKIVAADCLDDKDRPDRIHHLNEFTDMNWEVYPAGLTEILQWVHRRYGFKALYVTENGAAYPDRAGPPFVDEDRLSFIRDHLVAAKKAIDSGVPLRGYFVWSLLDNFEWALGYQKRFGIVHVDYETQERAVRRSGRWYANVAQAGFFEV